MPALKMSVWHGKSIAERQEELERASPVEQKHMLVFLSPLSSLEKSIIGGLNLNHIFINWNQAKILWKYSASHTSFSTDLTQ